jgi:hypothetical protein
MLIVALACLSLSIYERGDLEKGGNQAMEKVNPILGADYAAMDFKESQDATPSPTTEPYGKKISFTKRQKTIVYSSVALSGVAILAGAGVTIWCRKKNSKKRLIAVEQVMLPAPEDDYRNDVL